MSFSQILLFDDKVGHAILAILHNADREYLSFQQIRGKINAGRRRPYADNVIENTLCFYVQIGRLKEKDVNQTPVYAADSFPYVLKIPERSFQTYDLQSRFKAFFRPFSAGLERFFDTGVYGENCFLFYHAARLCIETPALSEDIGRLYEALAAWADSDPATMKTRISQTITNAWRLYILRGYVRRHPYLRHQLFYPHRFPELRHSTCPIDPPEYFRRIMRLYHSPVNVSRAEKKLWQSSDDVEISRYQYSGAKTVVLDEAPAFVDLCFGRENKRACKMFLSALYAALFVSERLEDPECFYMSAYWLSPSMNARRLHRFLNSAWERYLKLSGKMPEPCLFDPITFCARALDVLALEPRPFETAADVWAALLSQGQSE